MQETDLSPRTPREASGACDRACWHAYAEACALLGNELLEPMNRSGRTACLDPALWEAMPRPENSEAHHGLDRLIAYAREAKADTDAATDAAHPGTLAASVEYTHLFIGPPSPAASPWETAYVGEDEHPALYGRPTVHMRRLLAQEGLQLAGEGNQLEDHIGVELLYLSVLCEKTGQATGRGAGAASATKALARRIAQFAKEHPLSWIGAFRQRIDAARPNGYYSALVEYAHGLLKFLATEPSVSGDETDA